MNPATCLESLGRTGPAVAALLAGVPVDQSLWRPASGGWSLREIAAHLLDEEREDFRVRIDFTLHRPGAPWPLNDTEGWVTARRYQDRELPTTVAEFLDERARSLAWLGGLVDAPWERAYTHPKLGTLRAGDLLAAWAAHDLLHQRQILRRMWEHLAERSHPYALDYAGSW